MKLLKIAWLFAIACSLIFASCKKENEETLPPATQTGAGTFGCKINGKVYVPKGSSGTGTPNPKIQYDLDLQGKPYLSIETFQYPTQLNSGVIIAIRYLHSTGTYNAKDSFRFAIGSPTSNINCGTNSSDSTTYSKGAVTITRLDIPSRIISGTFNLKVKPLNCDTTFVTDGRFDTKF
jgi:hypothetical protein